VSCAQPTVKVFLQTVVRMESVHSTSMPFEGLNNQISITTNGEIPNTSLIWFQKFISSILSDRKICWIQRWNFFFKSDQNGGDNARRRGTVADSGRWKSLKCTVTPIIYNGFPWCLWHTHKCVGNEVCRREEFQKFITWAEPELKRRFLCGILHTTYRKKVDANQ